MPPFIIVQPVSQNVSVGANVTLSVVGGGSAPLSHQWLWNGTNLLAGMTANLTLTNVQLSDAGNYSVVVTNLVGSVVSSNAVLAVLPPGACVPPPVGVVGWWRAEGDATDTAGGNDGTLRNGATFGTGRVAQAFNFNGVNQFVEVSNSSNLNPPASFSIEGWIFPRQDRVQVILGKWGHLGDTPNQRSYIFHTQPGSGLLFAISDATLQGNGGFHSFSTTNNVIALNAWNHVAAVYDQTTGTRRIYANGIKVAERVDAPITVLNGTSKVGIGTWFPSSTTSAEYFDGLIDELSLYSRALSQSELQTIYTAGSAGKCVVLMPPFIVSQPRDLTATIGSNATFSLAAGGSVPRSYQWRYNGVDMPGATNSTLTLTNTQFNQAGSYSVLVTNLAGSVTSSNAVLEVVFPPAAVRVVNTTARAGGLVTVPIVLGANGNESALSFSLSFNKTRLTFDSVTLGADAAAASLLLNTNEINLGRLGVALALPAGTTLIAGTQAVVEVNFESAILLGGSSVATQITFGDQPTLRQLSDFQARVLEATYANGSVTLQPSDLEADVAPRPNGNRAVSVTDWVQVGRFAARLDAPTDGGEFERADCAPRASLGDGILKVTDWVQAGRYVASLDPLTAAGGPTSEVVVVSALLRGSTKGGLLGQFSSSNRVVTLSNSAAILGQTTVITTSLEAQGDENALGFSLNFDPAVFRFAGAALGASATGASLNVNSNLSASGKLGLLLALPAGNKFPAGSRELVKVSLEVNGLAAGSYTVVFSDQPVPRGVSDAAANELSASYLSGTVSINPPPSLSITRDGDHVTLSWPVWAATFQLQSLDTIVATLGSWTNVVVSAQTNGTDLSITLPVTGQVKLYRLSSP